MRKCELHNYVFRYVFRYIIPKDGHVFSYVFFSRVSVCNQRGGINYDKHVFWDAALFETNRKPESAVHPCTYLRPFSKSIVALLQPDLNLHILVEMLAIIASVVTVLGLGGPGSLLLLKSRAEGYQIRKAKWPSQTRGRAADSEAHRRSG